VRPRSLFIHHIHHERALTPYPRLQEDLNPDVRTTSERRLALLEGELVKAEQSNVEKKMVQRYRGVKFFGASSLHLSPYRSS